MSRGKMNPHYSGIIKKASYRREKSDYDDFYVVSRKETEEQIQNAEVFVEDVRKYLNLELSK